jgi:hypothetical protein
MSSASKSLIEEGGAASLGSLTPTAALAVAIRFLFRFLFINAKPVPTTVQRRHAKTAKQRLMMRAMALCSKLRLPSRLLWARGRR